MSMINSFRSEEEYDKEYERAQRELRASKNKIDMSKFDMGCGSCGAEMTWDEFEKANYYCPSCGWDSVRISIKSTHPIAQAPVNAGQDDWRENR